MFGEIEHGCVGMRKVQKGKDCSVEGCDNWCVSNDLCPKHQMALRRYGSVYGAKAGVRRGVCKGCGEDMPIRKAKQEYCTNQCYQGSIQYKEKLSLAQQNYRAKNKNRDKIYARGVFRRATPLKEMSDIRCLLCGSTEKLHRHHHNYNKPKDVIVLCSKCHGAIHTWDWIGNGRQEGKDTGVIGCECA
jgi:hypothetical protein